MAYVCETVEIVNNLQTCVQFVEYHQNFLDEINNLSRAESNKILTEIVGFWLLCSCLKLLLNFIEKN